MLPLAVATSDGFVACGKEVSRFSTSAASLFVCACVFRVIESVAFEALVNLNKALRFHIIGGDGCVKHHNPTR